MADIVPFRPAGSAKPAARNLVKGRRERLDDIGPADAVLGELLSYWRELRGPVKGVPVYRKTFDIQHLRRLMGWAHMVDVSEDEPANFRFRLYGSLADGLFQKDFTRLRLAEIPCPIYRGEIMGAYNTVKIGGCPTFHLIAATLDWRPTSYTRLVLPLADDQGVTRQLLVAVNRRPLPELAAQPWS